MRIDENIIKAAVRRTINKVLKEDWNDDRFEYDHFTDDGNGGIEEYGDNIASLLNGLGGDQDSLHAVGETVAEQMDEKDVRCFIEGMIVALKGNKGKGTDYQDIYNNYGITRN